MIPRFDPELIRYLDATYILKKLRMPNRTKYIFKAVQLKYFKEFKQLLQHLYETILDQERSLKERNMVDLSEIYPAFRGYKFTDKEYDYNIRQMTEEEKNLVADNLNYMKGIIVCLFEDWALQLSDFLLGRESSTPE